MQPVLKLKTYMDMFRQKRTRAESSIKSTAKRKRFQTQSGSDSKVTCAKSYKLETMVITTDSYTALFRRPMIAVLCRSASPDIQSNECKRKTEDKHEAIVCESSMR